MSRRRAAAVTAVATLVTLVVGIADIVGEDGGWNPWLTVAAVLSALTLILALWPSRPNGESQPQVTSTGSSGVTTRNVSAGRDVNINAPQPQPKPTPVLSLEIEELDPRTIPNWDNDWRVTIRVTNTSDTDNVSAYLLSPVEGLAEPDYGDFNLHWDSVNRNFTTLMTGKPERLHIARVSDSRIVRFLGPGQFSGQAREHQHKPIKVTDSPIRGYLLFSGQRGGRETRHVEIHLDHSNRPTVYVGDPEPHVV